jgi:hypothetical protein
LVIQPVFGGYTNCAIPALLQVEQSRINSNGSQLQAQTLWGAVHPPQKKFLCSDCQCSEDHVNISLGFMNLGGSVSRSELYEDKS